MEYLLLMEWKFLIMEIAFILFLQGLQFALVQLALLQVRQSDLGAVACGGLAPRSALHVLELEQRRFALLYFAFGNLEIIFDQLVRLDVAAVEADPLVCDGGLAHLGQGQLEVAGLGGVFRRPTVLVGERVRQGD